MRTLNDETQATRLAQAEARWPGTTERVRELRRFVKETGATLREAATAYNERHGSKLHASNVKRLLDAYPAIA